VTFVRKFSALLQDLEESMAGLHDVPCMVAMAWLMPIGVAWCLYLWLSQLVVKLEKTAVKHWQVRR